MTMFVLNGKRLNVDVPFEHDGVTYPANWLRLTTLAEKEAIGIVEITEQPRPDDRYYWVGDNGDGTYTTTPKDLDVVKAMKVSEVKQAAGSILSQSDWKVIRATETSTPLTPEFLAERQAIRDKSNTFEAQIAACTSVEELSQLSFQWVDPAP